MKKKILLIWQYARKDWIEVFENLSSDFDFVFCAEVFPESSVENVAHFANVTYWSRYKNAQEMLTDIEPHKIVFMGMESLHTAALNYAAKKKGIETLYLQHGLYLSLEYYLRHQEKTDALNPDKNLTKNKRHGIFMLKFYLASFKFHIQALSYLGKYIYFKNKLTQTQFLVNHKFEYRIADKYLVFTKKNAKYLSERDGFDKDRYIEIGNPSYDKYLNASIENKEYIVLIDNPLVETIAEGRKIKRNYSEEIVNKFYSTINDFAKKNSLKLKIKLHPYSYDSLFYVKDDNIEYIKNTNIVNMISEAFYVVSFSSTLTIPAILKKPFLLIRTNVDEGLFNDLEKWGLPEIPTLDLFDERDIKFQKIENNLKALNKLKLNYIYSEDGMATMRLNENLVK